MAQSTSSWITSFLAFGLVLGMTCTSAFAGQPGGVKVKGKVTQLAVARNVINLAAGKEAKAGLSMATIHGNADISGAVTQLAVARNVINLAAGLKTKACLQMASIGDNPACK